MRFQGGSRLRPPRRHDGLEEGPGGYDERFMGLLAGLRPPCSPSWRSWRTRLLVCALAPLALDLPAAASGELRPTPQRTRLPEAGAQLPVRWWCSYPLVSVHVEGKGPFPFLLDTGAGACVLSRELAARFPDRLRVEGVRARGPEGQPLEVGGVVTLERVAVGELELEVLDAVVLDLASLTPVLRTPIAGILGAPAFAGVTLSFDGPAREVRVSHERLAPPGEDGVIGLLPGATPRLFARQGDARFVVVLDTGCGDDLRLPAWPPDARFLCGPVADLPGFGLAGAGAPAEVARFEGTLHLGTVRVERPVVRRVPGEPRVGAPLLARLVWSLDGPSRAVQLGTPDGRPLAVAPYRTFGAALVADGDALLVREVLPRSEAARAGLAAGDRILSVEGLGGADLVVCDTLRELVAGGKTLHLRIERGAEALELAFPPTLLLP